MPSSSLWIGVKATLSQPLAQSFDALYGKAHYVLFVYIWGGISFSILAYCLRMQDPVRLCAFAVLCAFPMHVFIYLQVCLGKRILKRLVRGIVDFLVALTNGIVDPGNQKRIVTCAVHGGTAAFVIGIVLVVQTAASVVRQLFSLGLFHAKLELVLLAFALELASMAAIIFAGVSLMLMFALPETLLRRLRFETRMRSFAVAELDFLIGTPRIAQEAHVKAPSLVSGDKPKAIGAKASA
jgi:hypothetical protein